MFYDRGVAHCVKLDGFARIAELHHKHNQKMMSATEETETERETPTATASPSEPTPRKGKRILAKRENWRPITACPGGSDFLSSVCILGTTRGYYILCRGHLVNRQYFGYHIGECREDEICVSAGSVRYNLFQDYVKSHCVKHEGFARIGKVFQKYHKQADVGRTDSTTQITRTQTRQGKRDQVRRLNWRPILECPGNPYLEVRMSACKSGNPHKYFVACQYPGSRGVPSAGFVYRLGQCSGNEVCVSGSTDTASLSPYHNMLKDYGIAHCVKHDGFDRIAQLAREYKLKAENRSMENEGTKSKGTEREGAEGQGKESRKSPSRRTEAQKRKRKRSLEKRSGWRPVNQCPDEFTGWTFVTSVCDSTDPRKFWIICHAPYPNGRFGPSFISHPDACSTTEVCVSGYRGEVPKTPIPAYQIRDFGTAKCASQQSFVRIARLVTKHGGGKAGKRLAKRARRLRSHSDLVVHAFADSQRTFDASSTSQKVQPVDPAQWIQKPSISRPLNVCPEPHRGWTVISSSCDWSGGSHQDFRMWCSRDPYASPGCHVRLKGRCSNDEVCVPGAGGVETIPHPGGRKQGLTDARRAACVHVERISRIAKVMLDGKSKVNGRYVPAE